MAFSNIMKTFAAVVCFTLLQSANSVPLPKLSKSGQPVKHSVHKRSPGTVEFFMNQDSHNTLTNEDQHLTQIVSQSQGVFNNDYICPTTVFTGVNDPIHKRSSCPWYYTESHDPRRFPAAILTAKPICTYAIGSGNTLECSPITQTLTVLRQQDVKDASGNYIWAEDTETVVIGYTATGRRLAESQPTTSAPTDQAIPDYA